MATGGYSNHDTNYTDRIFIDGIGPATDQSELKHFLGRHFGEEPWDIKYGTSENCVATFKHWIDTSQRPKDTLDGHTLYFERVPLSFCLLMSEIPARLSEQAICQHFTTKKLPGGGGISNIESKDGTTLISFQDHRDMEENCQNENYWIGPHRVRVQIYYKQLHQTGSNESSVVSVSGFATEKIEFLIRDEITKYVKAQMRKKGLNGHWKIQDGQVNVYSINDESGAEIAHLIKNSIIKKEIKLSQESLPLMDKKSWQKAKQQARDCCSNYVDFNIDRQGLVFSIISTDQDAALVVVMINDYLINHTIYKTDLKLASEILRELRGRQKNDLEKIRQDLGLTISVMHEDITNLKVDAIANPTDKDMKHLGGLAKAIMQKGGKSIRSECTQHIQSHGGLKMSEVFCSKAGALPCRNVLHCCVPVWQDGQHLEGEDLRYAVQNSLQTACDKNFQSIALPALGSDNQPEALSSQLQMLHSQLESSANDYDYDGCESEENSNTMEERISLKPYQIQILKRSDIMRTLSAKNPHGIAKLDLQTECAIFYGPSDSVTQAMKQVRKLLEGIKIKKGPFSRKKLIYIREKQTKTFILKMLKERNIYCVYWTVENDDLIVYGLSDNDVVATFFTIKDNVTEFTIDLCDAEFDLTRGQEFRDYLEKINNDLDAYVAVTIEGKSLVIVTITAKKDLTKELIEQFFIEKSITMSHAQGNTSNNINYPTLAEISNYKMATYCVTLVQGNITDVVIKKKVDVLVNSISLLRDGGLAREIFRKAGSNVKQQVKDQIKTGEVQEGDFHITDGGLLKCQKIVHVFCCSWEEGRRQEKEHLFQNVLSCLQRANSLGLESIVFPPLGTGICAMPPIVSAKTIADAVVNFYERTSHPHVTQIYICCKEQDHVNCYKSKLSKRFQGSNASDATERTIPNSQTHEIQPLNCEVILTRDPVKIKLLKLPKTAQYIDDTIREKVDERYELKIGEKEIKLSALTSEIAEFMKETVTKLIVKKVFPTRHGIQKENELIHFENHVYPGKFIYLIDENKVVLCGTFDVIWKRDVIDLENKLTQRCVIL